VEQQACPYVTPQGFICQMVKFSAAAKLWTLAKVRDVIVEANSPR
jgi:hypothetical protein